MRLTNHAVSSSKRFGARLAMGRCVSGILILGVLWVSMLEPANAASPAWKIGRAVIETRMAGPGQPSPAVPGQPAPAPGQRLLVVKLSLRNEGAPGNVPVRIFGRWLVQPLLAFTPLGSFAQEVAFKQVAILEFPLTPLRFVPPGKVPLELSVMTGAVETDRQPIRMPE